MGPIPICQVALLVAVLSLCMNRVFRFLGRIGDFLDSIRIRYFRGGSRILRKGGSSTLKRGTSIRFYQLFWNDCTNFPPKPHEITWIVFDRKIPPELTDKLNTCSCLIGIEVNAFKNKKVLLREYKRLSTHRVASAHSAALSPNVCVGGGELMGGVSPPSSPDEGGGTPIQSQQGGTSIQSWPRGYPIQFWWGRYPHPVSTGVTPSSLNRGGSPIQSQWGVSPWPGRMGYPPVRKNVVPPVRKDGGTPHWPGGGYPPPPSTGWGYLPPTGVNRLKILPSVILRMRGGNDVWRYCGWSKTNRNTDTGRQGGKQQPKTWRQTETHSDTLTNQKNPQPWT